MKPVACLFSSDGLSGFIVAFIATVAICTALAIVAVWRITR